MKSLPSRKTLKAPLRPVPAAVAAALTALLASSAAAQQTSAEPAAEQITVTGSRIRGIAPIGSAVVGVSRDSI